MKFLNKATAITAILMFTLAIPLVAVPLANAHDPAWNITTYAYINVSPDPVGVGQKVDVLIWLDKVYGSNPMLTNNYRFHNYNLTIVNSDTDEKVLEKIFDIVKDTTSSQYYAWTPDEVGTYTLYFTFPGQDYNTGVAGEYDPNSVFVNDTFLPSSASTTLTVQEEQLDSPITSYPLPAEYWTRPIYGENTDWWSVSSNWLGTGSPEVSSYSFSGSYYARALDGAVGSQTAHIMWAKALQFGGVVGGTGNTAVLGDTWFEGSAYNQRYTNPIIVGGYLYYTEPMSYYAEGSFRITTVPYHGPTVCVDLRTGEVIWSRDDVPVLSFAYVYDVQDPQQHGVFPALLFTSNFAEAYDAFTGDYAFSVTGAPSGTAVLGPQGEHLRYVFANLGTSSSPDWTLGQWNSSKLWTGLGFANPTFYQLSPTPDFTTTTSWHWENTTTWVNGVETTTSKNVTTTTTAVDASISAGAHTRYDWNVTVSDINAMSRAPSVIAAVYGDIMICYNGSLPMLDARSGVSRTDPYTYFAINLNSSKGTVGNVLWWNTVNAPSGNLTVATGGVDPVNRVFYEIYKETSQFVGYDMDTGAKLWTTDGQGALDYYGNPAFPYVASTVAYGKLYSIAYGGILYCYDTATGDLVWTYGDGEEGNSTRSGFYLAYGHYPAFIGAIGNDIVYTFTAEHTVNTPLYKGALARAINATDGTEIWTLSDYDGSFFAISYAIADGYNTFFNGYDNRIYVVGRGPSATTVSAPDVAAAFGQPVMIKGTVMDVSAGLKLYDEQVSRFPNGVPAVSDENMDEWMGYVWQQRPFPSDCTGVTVLIDVLDSNGNYRNIGTTTSDASGVFNFEWTPDIPGKFVVIATFEGTNGYWPSYAETAFTVMEPAEATPGPTEPPASMTDAYVAGFGIGIIIVIVVVGLVIILMLRRR